VQKNTSHQSSLTGSSSRKYGGQLYAVNYKTTFIAQT
jgi:hypothetical protein